MLSALAARALPVRERVGLVINSSDVNMVVPMATRKSSSATGATPGDAETVVETAVSAPTTEPEAEIQVTGQAPTAVCVIKYLIYATSR